MVIVHPAGFLAFFDLEEVLYIFSLTKSSSSGALDSVQHFSQGGHCISLNTS